MTADQQLKPYEKIDLGNKKDQLQVFVESVLEHQGRSSAEDSSVAPDAIHEARARGADGFLPKSASAEDILEAISCALSGQPCFPINSGNSATVRGPDTPSLTARQLDVLSLLCTGRPNKVIARDLGLSENTVRVHVAAIFAQLGVNSRSAALLAAQRLGLSTPQLHDPL